MTLPLRIAKCEPVPVVTEVKEKAPGVSSGPAPVVAIFGPGFLQPIGQKGSRSAGAESKVDFVLVRLWVITPQVLAHEIEAGAEQVERRAERVARRRHPEIVAPRIAFLHTTIQDSRRPLGRIWRGGASDRQEQSVLLRRRLARSPLSQPRYAGG